MKTEIVIGKIYVIEYPFVKAEYESCHNGCTKPTWNPGCRFEFTAPDDGEYFCDAMGHMILTVVSTHKPAHYPERVFYLRKWETPMGKRFGKDNLRIISTGAFKRMLNGYRHEFNPS